MAEPVEVRPFTAEECDQLLHIVRRNTGSLVRWRRAQVVLLSARGMDVQQIAELTFAAPDRVAQVIESFNTDGIHALDPQYSGGRHPTLTPEQRAQIKSIAQGHPNLDFGLPFTTWSLARLAEYLMAEGVVDDISNETLRLVLMSP